jgi:hypothetical protein
MAASQTGFQGFDFVREVISSKVSSNFSALCQFGSDVCLYGFSTFLPIIIQAMGYDSVKAQYLTIPGEIACGVTNF